jgi:hypothetical protein
MAAHGTWWAVLLPGEDEHVYGPFRSVAAAQKCRDEWNSAHPDDLAYVIPLRDPKGLS